VTYSVDKVTAASALVEALQPFEGAIDKLIACLPPELAAR
jgi:hypothetical protein